MLLDRMENNRFRCIDEPFASVQQAPAKLIILATNLASGRGSQVGTEHSVLLKYLFL